MKLMLTVICPVYNEESVLRAFHQELSQVLSGLDKYHSTMLFVVDRCSDNSLELLRTISQQDPRVQVLSLSSRFGHQMSLLAGIDHARADAVIMMDSDLQHPPNVIPKLLQKFEAGYEIVYTIRKDLAHSSFLQKGFSKLFYKAINLLSQVSIHESSADFRLISGRVARVFQEQIRERNLFLRGLFAWVGFKTTGVEFTVQDRRSGKSKYTFSRLLHFALTGIISFSKRPLDAAILVGFASAFIACLTGVVTLIQYFTSSHLPSGWTTLVILITFYSGVHLVFLGIFGEYIGAIFDEVKKRPHYLVEESIGIQIDRGTTSDFTRGSNRSLDA